MGSYTFLIASARRNGNSEQLAKIASASLGENASQRWLDLKDVTLDPFHDLRHVESGYDTPRGDELELFDATVNCTDLVFVTPVYWYSLPAPLKLYLDYWSAWLRVDGLNFKTRMKGKRLWAISTSAGPAEEANSMFESLRLSANYMGMQWGGSVLGNGSAAGDVLKDTRAVELATYLFH